MPFQEIQRAKLTSSSTYRNEESDVESEGSTVASLNACRLFQDSSSTDADKSAFTRRACLTEATFPSLGSEAHTQSQCKPCSWFWKPQGCQNGRDCLHCHLCPPGEVKRRKKSLQVTDAQLPHLNSTVVMECSLPVLEPVVSSIRPPPGLLPPFKVREALQAVDLSFSTTTEDDFPSLCASQRSVSTKDDEHDTCDEEPELQGFRTPVSMTIGSCFHEQGLCKPCSWFWKPQGCQNGVDCLHCHLCPKGEVKLRKKQQQLLEKKTQQLQEQYEALQSECLRLQQQQLSVHLQQLQLASQTLPAQGPSLQHTSLASRGSTSHWNGTCKPCAWFWKPQGCGHGQKCEYCHLCGRDEIKLRKQVKHAVLRAMEVSDCIA